MVGGARNTFGGVTNVDYFDGAVLVNGNNPNAKRWGMTMGNMINSNRVRASIDDPLFMHEYGHTQQSKLLGPLYPLIVGIPSLVSASLFSMYDDGQSHSLRWYEKSANRHAKRYFEKHHGKDWGDVQRRNKFEDGTTQYPTY
jgi:hypothetical protein